MKALDSDAMLLDRPLDFNDGNFFSNDAMVMIFFQGTIAKDGFF